MEYPDFVCNEFCWVVPKIITILHVNSQKQPLLYSRHLPWDGLIPIFATGDRINNYYTITVFLLGQ
jgi:hypothetical protein